MDKSKTTLIDEILYGLHELGRNVIKGDFATTGLHNPFLLMWALKKICLDTAENYARDRVFERIEEGLGNDKINLRQVDIEYVLGVIEKTAKIPTNSLVDFFKPSSYAFEKLSAVNNKHNVKIPFYKLDITTEPGEIYKYLIIKDLWAFESINPKVAEIAKAILKVEDGEKFSDFMSGTALTTEIITISNSTQKSTYMKIIFKLMAFTEIIKGK